MVICHYHLISIEKIKREDKECYQTVFSDKLGAVAVPTAGLHFTTQLLDELKNNGIDNIKLTLHAGAGTFQPVRVDDIANHHMHNEYARVPLDVVEKINETTKKWWVCPGRWNNSN